MNKATERELIAWMWMAGGDAAITLNAARMEWLDAQNVAFRALVQKIGLNRACQKDGRRPPV